MDRIFHYKSFFPCLFQWILLVVLMDQVKEIQCHGRLMDPPARNCQWRYGFPNPVDYNDNELFCGGQSVQWSLNGGKCGVCGDAWNQPEPRPHEDGGKYGNGIIVRRYIAGQDISVEVELTANHRGTFKFKLCAQNWNKHGKTVTQECFDKYPLYIVNPNGNLTEEFVITHKRAQLKSAVYHLIVRLPLYVTCTRCILQWTYRTGNSWGFCGDTGVGALGCGPQETFINCADVSILSNTGTGHGPVNSSSPSLPIMGGGNHYGHNVHNPYLIYYRDYSKKGKPIVPLIVRSQACFPTAKYRGYPGMDKYCQKNCMMYPPNCPSSQCKCY